MLRPVLIFAFLASLGAALYTFLVTKPAIETVNANLLSTQDQLTKSQADASAAKKSLSETRAAKEVVDKELAVTKGELEEATTKANDQEARANKLTTDLAKTTTERNDARNELAKWTALGLRPADIDLLKIGKKAAEDERDSLAAEKIIFLRKVQTLQSKLDQFVEPDKEVPLPVGLKGRVVAVDPKWNFVMLDIGANSNLLERGQMKVHRDGKLISKVRIISVAPTWAIANVMPEWLQPGQAVAEGDAVLY